MVLGVLEGFEVVRLSVCDSPMVLIKASHDICFLLHTSTRCLPWPPSLSLPFQSCSLLRLGKIQGGQGGEGQLEFLGVGLRLVSPFFYTNFMDIEDGERRR